MPAVTHQPVSGACVDPPHVGGAFGDVVELLLDVGRRYTTRRPASSSMSALPGIVQGANCRLSGGTDPRWLRGAGLPFSSGAGVVEHGMHFLPEAIAGWNLRPARLKSSAEVLDGPHQMGPCSRVLPNVGPVDRQPEEARPGNPAEVAGAHQDRELVGDDLRVLLPHVGVPGHGGVVA